MQYLLDTHVFLWAAAKARRLSAPVREAIQDRANVIYLSSAAAWEIAVKYSIGKLSLPLAPAAYVPARADALSLLDLPLRREHALAAASLPNHHGDPFDRIMIAQAQVEALCLITADPLVLKYPIHLLDAR